MKILARPGSSVPRRRFALPLVVLALASACQDGNVFAPKTPPESGPPAAFAITASDTLFRSLGDSLVLAARTSSGEVIAPAKIEWASSNSAVLSVSGGVATARANGRATVTGRMGERESSWTFRVRQVAVRVDLSAAEYSIPGPGRTVQLSAAALDRRGNAIPDAPLAWSSDAPARIAVSSTGLASASGWGSGRVRVSTGGTVASQARVRVTGGAAPAVARLRAGLVPGGADPTPAFALVVLNVADPDRDLDSVRLSLLDAAGAPVAVVADTAAFGEPNFALEVHATRAARVTQLRLDLVDHAGNRVTQLVPVPRNPGPASPVVDDAQWVRIAGDSVRVDLAMTDPELDVDLLWAVGLNDAGGWTFIRAFEVPLVDEASWTGSIEFAASGMAQSTRLGILALDRAGNVSSLFIQPNAAASPSLAPAYSRIGGSAAILRARSGGEPHPRRVVRVRGAR